MSAFENDNISVSFKLTDELAAAIKQDPGTFVTSLLEAYERMAESTDSYLGTSANQIYDGDPVYFNFERSDEVLERRPA